MTQTLILNQNALYMNTASCIFETRAKQQFLIFNPLNAELNPICHLLALLEAHPILHVNRVRVKNRASCI